jgi:hypothetical protein
MSQQDVAVINLEPIGGRKVTAEEFGQTVKNIFEQIERLGKQPVPDNDTDSDTSNTKVPEKPAVNMAEVKKYAFYAGSGLLGLWLIRKAMKS